MNLEDICWSRGPRIGNEGAPFCKKLFRHEGRHTPDPEDGWEPGMSWGDPLIRSIPSIQYAILA
jgi:hypothetical protein